MKGAGAVMCTCSQQPAIVLSNGLLQHRTETAREQVCDWLLMCQNLNLKGERKSEQPCSSW